jgi:hypothetical protein
MRDRNEKEVESDDDCIWESCDVGKLDIWGIGPL